MPSQTKRNARKQPSQKRQPYEHARSDAHKERAKEIQREREQRKLRLSQTQERNGLLRGLLEALNIPLPARIEFPERDYADRSPQIETTEISADLFLIRSTTRNQNYKVQRISRGWTCSCPRWKNVRIACAHVRAVLARRGKGAPYAHARRSPVPAIIYDLGQRSESTRRANASLAVSVRARELLVELCEQISNLPPKHPRGEGRPAIPLQVRVYCIVTKLLQRLTYAQLCAALREDDALAYLGWTKHGISQRSLSNICGDPSLEPELRRMIERTASTVRNVEETAIIDATGFPNSIAGNYNDETYGGRRRPSGRRYIKVHLARGKETTMVPFVDITTDNGRGSADAPHLGRVLRGSKAVWGRLGSMLADGAYGNKGNYTRAEALRIKLVTPERSHEDRTKWRGAIAAQATEDRHDPAAFYDEYRYRSKVEGIPSSVKRHQAHLRLRKRVSDPEAVVPTAENDEKLCDLPDAKLDVILDHAQEAVGAAVINETLAMFVAANLRTIVTLEHLHDQKMTLLSDSTFQKIPAYRLDDLLRRATAAGSLVPAELHGYARGTHDGG